MDENGNRSNLQPDGSGFQQPVQPQVPQGYQPQVRQPMQQPQVPQGYQQPTQPRPQQPPYQQPQVPQGYQPPYQQPPYQQPPYQQPAQPQPPQGYQPQYRQPMQQAQAPQGYQPQVPQPAQPQYAPQGYGQQPAKKKKWIIPVAIIAAVIVIGGIAALALLSSPAALIARAASNTSKAILNNDILTTAQETANGGSLDVHADLSKLSTDLLGTKMTLEGDVKVYSDVGKNKSAMEVTLEALGTTIDAGLYLDNKQFVIDSDFIFDGEAYGIDLSKAYKELEDSPFGPHGAYPLDSDTYETLSQVLESFADDNHTDAALEGLVKDGTKIAKDYVSFILKTVMKYAEVEKESSKLSIGGGREKVTDVSVKLDSEALGKLVETVLKKVAEDKTLRNYLEDLAEYLDDKEFYYEDFADIFDEFYDDLDDILDDIDDIKDDLEDSDSSISFDFYINAKTQLIGVLLKVEENGYTEKMQVLYGPDADSPNEISLTIGDKNEGDVYRYLVDKNDEKTYKAEFTYSYWGYEDFCVSVDYDKKDGDFAISGDDGYDEITVRGNLKKAKDGYVITFDGLDGDDVPEEVNMILSCIDMTVKTKDTAPTLPAYTDVLKLSKKQIEKLVEDIAGEFMGLVGNMW